MKSRLALLAVAATAAATLAAPQASTAASPTATARTASTATTAATATTTATAAVAPRGVTTRNGCITSVPDPGTSEKVKICWTLFKPRQASRSHKVPLIMHSHGWGGSRTTDPASFRQLLNNGYGVLSYDQRGFGESGGQAYVENPFVEGQDVSRLVGLVARQPWVAKDGPGDPRLGAIGGSYGGGYQFLGAFELLRKRGTPVFDALAPEITWWDLKGSLAPSEVVRTEWALALSAAALPSDSLPPKVYEALAEGAATGTWPDGSQPGTANLDPFFRRNGPKWHVDHGRKLDIPVLVGQGTTDGLFPLRQGIDNWLHAITRGARMRSLFVGYNGGHVLPQVFPRGVDVTSDPCSQQLGGGDFANLAVKFFNTRIKGWKVGLRGFGRMHYATPDSTCTTRWNPFANETREIGTVATPTAAGPSISYKVADGPIRIAGAPYLTGSVTSLGADNRGFFGLAVGTTAADAHLVQNNQLPFRARELLTGERRTIPLPAVAVDVPEGQSLFLMANALDDTFAGMASRTPGVITVDGATVHLPVVR